MALKIFYLFALVVALIPCGLCLICTSSESSPNPIFSQYPTTPTGTINGTILILPIPYKLARSIVPAQYPILKSAYHALLPRSFPKDSYPMFLQPVLDHDVRSGSIAVLPDFSRSVLSFPFVDLLNDGYSSFRYSDAVLLSDNPVALAGAAVYGPPLPLSGVIDPPCDAYKFIEGGAQGEVGFDGYLGLVKLPGQKPVVSTRVTPVQEQPYDLAFYRNITNQPSFGNGVVCDNFITLFNSSITTGANKPVPVKGQVELKKPFFSEDRTFRDVHGLKLDLAFIENNYVPCTQLKGYSSS